jgi:hypothetical protein
VINPQTLLDAMVARLRTIPELVAVFPSPEDQIRAYHHDFAARVSWFAEIAQGSPGMVIRWSGTAPGYNRQFVHSFEAAVRVPEKPVAESQSFAIYTVFCGFVNGKPGGVGGCCDRNWLVPLSNDVEPMKPPTMRPVTDANGLDYWIISYVVPEKGDTC